MRKYAKKYVKHISPPPADRQRHGPSSDKHGVALLVHMHHHSWKKEGEDVFSLEGR
jgi:hypothetical protein